MKMERDFNIQCSSESEYGPLNKRWCLKQIQKDGTKAGRDLVPTSHRHYFEASKVVLTISHRDGHAEVTSEKIETKEVIYAALVPEGSSSRTYLKAPCYYMLGYRDAVEEISLEIHRSENDDYCTVASYEKVQSDTCFDDHPHIIYFSVKLSATKFDVISQLVKLDRLDHLSLAVQYVDGFYSEHSYDSHDYIDSIYILSRSALEDLRLEEYAEHLPVTGKVEGFKIDASSKVEVDLNKANDCGEPVIISGQDHDSNTRRLAALEGQIERENALLSRVPEIIASLNRLLKRIYLPLWFVVLLLFLIFVQNL